MEDLSHYDRESLQLKFASILDKFQGLDAYLQHEINHGLTIEQCAVLQNTCEQIAAITKRLKELKGGAE